MPDPAPNPKEKLRSALEAMNLWLREHRTKESADFGKLCAAHAEVASELQELLSLVQIAQAAATSRSFQQTVREQFGEDAEVTVKLEDGFGVPPSGGVPTGRPEGGTPSSRYALEEEVARGGMGVIWRVRDRDLSRTLAMKVMTPATGASPQATDATTRLGLARFLEEAQVTAQLDHPGIVPVHEVGFDAQGQPFFTMKLVKDRDLNEIFRLARAGEGWSGASKAIEQTSAAFSLSSPEGGEPLSQWRTALVMEETFVSLCS